MLWLLYFSQVILKSLKPVFVSLMTNYRLILRTTEIFSRQAQFYSTQLLLPKTFYTFRSNSLEWYSQLSLNNVHTLPIVNQAVLMRYFQVFIASTVSTVSSSAKVHSSWRSFFVGNKNHFVFWNLARTFAQFKALITLLRNLFFYDVVILYFSSYVFRTEVDALNWNHLATVPILWRYAYPFLTTKYSKIFDYGWAVFRLLRERGYNMAFVLDIIYHHKTLYYLDRESYFTLGLVPLWYHSNSVNVALPTLSDDLISQLFTFRLVLAVKRDTKGIQYGLFIKSWANLTRMLSQCI